MWIALEPAERLLDDREIGDGLRGVLVVGHGVDDAHGALRGERLQLQHRLVGADHQHVEVLREGAPGVLQPLAGADAEVVGAVGDGVGAEPHGGHGERGARAGGGRVEVEPHVLARERRVPRPLAPGDGHRTLAVRRESPAYPSSVTVKKCLAAMSRALLAGAGPGIPGRRGVRGG